MQFSELSKRDQLGLLTAFSPTAFVAIELKGGKLPLPDGRLIDVDGDVRVRVTTTPEAGSDKGKLSSERPWLHVYKPQPHKSAIRITSEGMRRVRFLMDVLEAEKAK